MFSQRGVMMLAHTVHDEQELQAAHPREPAERHRQRVAHARSGQGVLPAAQHRGPTPRYPVVGAALQRRGGVARHDAVAWGYARGAAARGVDIIQNCPVTAIRRDASGAASPASRSP